MRIPERVSGALEISRIRSARGSRKASRCSGGAISSKQRAGSPPSARKPRKTPPRPRSCARRGSWSGSPTRFSCNRSGNRGVREVWARQVRWARLRRVSFFRSASRWEFCPVASGPRSWPVPPPISAGLPWLLGLGFAALWYGAEAAGFPPAWLALELALALALRLWGLDPAGPLVRGLARPQFPMAGQRHGRRPQFRRLNPGTALPTSGLCLWRTGPNLAFRGEMQHKVTG